VHDPLSTYDLVHDELDQRLETGYLVQRDAETFAGLAPEDEPQLEAVYRSLTAAPRDPDWRYDEPRGAEAVFGSLGSMPAAPPPSDVADRVLGGWLGRIAGCNLGKPVEQGDHWTSSHLRTYLELAGAWPLRDYIPVIDPLPPEYVFRDNWVNTTLGRVSGSDRDDDIDYPILNLHLLEQHGRDLSPGLVAHAWLTYLPYLQIYTAERVAYRNLLERVPAAEVATHRNPYREWIGALIRGDVFGWTNPGDPLTAARLAYQDASLSHVDNGIYGEMWSAALVASAFTAATVRDAFDASLAAVPPGSRLAEALEHVRSLKNDGRSWEEALAQIQAAYGHYSWVHTINNAAIIAAGLLWGDDDYASTVGLTVAGGWDTDSNGATAGSVAGVVLGAQNLPAQFIDPLEDRTRSALFGFDHSVISQLAQRTTRLATRGDA
jgi:ADP-ribosylglycohydrolase